MATAASTAYLGLDTFTKKVVFYGYIAFWVTQNMLVYAFRKHRHHINFTTVAGLIEMTKLVFSLVAFYKQDYANSQRIKFSVAGPLFLKYTIPAFLYAVYNNLAYVILAMTDPGTHGILSNARTLLTAVVWRYAFSKSISNDKWKALFLITAGCFIKGLETFTPESTVNLWIILLILIQICTATAAGVYMEFLLKGYKDIPVNLQNSFMYVNCILGNVIIMVLRQLHSNGWGVDGGRVQTLAEAGSAGGNASAATTTTTVSSGAGSGGDGLGLGTILADPFALTVVVFGAMTGMSTGFFLRYLDSVLKTIATSIELLLLPFASMVCFGTNVGVTTFVAVLCVAQGTLLYSKKPTKKSSVKKGTETGETLDANGNKTTKDDIEKNGSVE
jgi:UDP-sugar transporter A1/2/3